MSKIQKKEIELKIQKTFLAAYSLYNPKIKLNNTKYQERTLNLKNSAKLLPKTTLNNKFYKLLMKNKNKHSTINQNKSFIPNIVERNNFIFSFDKEKAESIERKKREGDIKHLELSKISFLKKIEKMNSAREFKNKMKLIIHNNIENMRNKKFLEEKKQMKDVEWVRKPSNTNKNFIFQSRERINDIIKEQEKKMEKMKKKLNVDNIKIKKKYNEIMTKLNKS